jgi:hypothetical protein
MYDGCECIIEVTEEKQLLGFALANIILEKEYYYQQESNGV